MAKLVKAIEKRIEVQEVGLDRCQVVVFVDNKPDASYVAMSRANSLELAQLLASNDDARAFVRDVVKA